MPPFTKNKQTNKQTKTKQEERQQNEHLLKDDQAKFIEI